MTSPRDDLNRSEPLYQQVAHNIRNSIEAGILRDGEALPSTRELAEQWGVSVFVISEAMKVLVEQGLVVTKSRSKRLVHNPDGKRDGEIRLRKPHIVFVGGYAGSGKSEFGRILARETGWPILDKDTLTRPVVEAALETLGVSPNDRESQTYLSVVRPREYQALLAATKENVECGNSAIVTAPFIREFNDPAWLERIEAMYSAIPAVVSFVWMHCDAETMHTYIRARGAARDAAKLSDWPEYLSRIDLDFRPLVPHTVVDNSASSSSLQSQAKTLLKATIGGELR